MDQLIEGIAAARVFRDRPGKLPAVVRPEARPILLHADAGGYFSRDSFRNPHIEISLNDFGLEESYGRFVKDKVYAIGSPDVCGGLVDLYV